MSDVILIVEGHSEAGLKHFFDPHLQVLELYNLKGIHNLLKDWAAIAQKELKDNPQARVLCLADYDVLAKKYPLGAGNSLSEHVAHIRTQLEGLIPPLLRPQVKCFPVIQAAEAWMLADERGLGQYLNAPSAIERTPDPEHDSTPKKSLAALFRNVNKAYSESVDGKALLAQSGKADRISQHGACQFFQQLWDEVIDWDASPVAPANPKAEALIQLNAQLNDCNRQLEKKEQDFYLRMATLPDDQLAALSQAVQTLEAKREGLKFAIQQIEATLYDEPNQED